jgi:glycosyltransferase involved in cell wall biosynthesis
MPSPSRPSQLDLLIHCSGSHGTVADQIHRQACAFHELGLNILVLCGPNFVRTRAADYPVLPCLLEGATGGTSNIMSRKVAKSFQTLVNQLRFGWEVFHRKPVIVLSGSHVTSQSAIWVWPHMLASLFRKTIYTTNLHFSTREHNLGPKWWQNLNAALSFRPFRIGIAHKRFAHPSPVPSFIKTVEVPLGPERHANIRENPKIIRRRWKVGRGKKVFLAFGPVRNHKNIDLAIRALADNPEAHLVILGSVPTHKDRPIKYYQMLAEDLGVSKRLYISEEFIPDEKRVSHFQAADFIMLTYSSAYHSQSATLSTAVAARRMVLGSSGNSPMRDLVRHFGLGVYVDPDSSEAIADAMATLLHAKFPQPDWRGFEEFATWETNATRILQAVSDYVAGRPLPGRLFEGLEDEAAPQVELLRAEDFAPAPKARKPQKPRAVRKAAEPAVIASEEKPAARETRPPAKAPKPTRKPRAPKESPKEVQPAPAAKRPRGRPRRNPEAAPAPVAAIAEPVPQRRRGRPPKNPAATVEPTPAPASAPVSVTPEPAPEIPPAPAATAVPEPSPQSAPQPTTPPSTAPEPSFPQPSGILSRAFESSRLRTSRPLPVFVSTANIFANSAKSAAPQSDSNGHASGGNGSVGNDSAPRPRRGRKKALAA